MVTVCGREEQKMSNKKLKGKGADFANFKIQRQESNCQYFLFYIIHQAINKHIEQPFCAVHLVKSDGRIMVWDRSILKVGQYCS